MKLVIAFSAQEHVDSVLLQILLRNFPFAKITTLTPLFKIHVFLFFIIILVILLNYNFLYFWLLNNH